MSHHHLSVKAAAALGIAALLSFACGRDEQQAPAAQTQTQTPVQSMSVPESVTGCLRAGDAADTFVLTTSQTDDGKPPTTYELVGTTAVNLQDHVGHRVAVNGIVREQQSATSGSASAPATDKPRGTSGTPSVQTTATLQLRRMEVQSVARASGECDK
jgi:hypothetical protein